MLITVKHEMGNIDYRDFFFAIFNHCESCEGSPLTFPRQIIPSVESKGTIHSFFQISKRYSHYSYLATFSYSTFDRTVKIKKFSVKELK